MHTPATPRLARGVALAGLAASLLSAGALSAQTPSAPRTRPAAARPAAAPQKVATVEGISEYRLANGMRVLLFPDPSKPTVTVNVTYFVGSRHEGYGETGMAHLLEHLVFKGTPRHRNIADELKAHGARANGTTWYDRTNYYETVPATDSNLVWALDLESDRMVNSFIAKKDLDSEFSVVRNEFESGENSPTSVLLERTMATAFLWHNYGNTTIGARADLENVPIERLQAFYRRYYQPDNAMLVVAGKFDEARTLRLVQEKFGRVPKPVRSLDRGNMLFPTYTAEPTQDGERTVTLRRVGDVQAVRAVYHVPPGSHADFAAVDVLTRVLGDVPAGRLHKALVETKLAASAGAFNFQLREPGVIVGAASVRKESSLDSAAAVLVRTIEEIVRTPATQEEVDRAKTATLKNFELAMNNSQQLALELSEWAATGDWRLFFLHRDRLRGVTAADVNRVAQAYIKPANRTVGLFIPTEKPDRAEIPEVPNVAAMVANYKGDTAVAMGEAFDPSPANIASRTTVSKLPNGLELALLPKKTRGAMAEAVLDLRFGSEQALAGRSTAGQLAGAMLMRGTATRTRQQLRDEIDRLKARITVSGGATSARATIQAPRENLLQSLQLVAEMLKQPAFDAKEFEQLREQALAGTEQNRSQPNTAASIAFNRQVNAWPKGHPLYVETIDEQVAELRAATVDAARQFHAEFYGANNATMAIVGDFDAAAVTKFVTESFGAWNSRAPYQRIGVPFRTVAARDSQINTPDKANAFFIAGLPLEIREGDPDFAAMSLANYMLGGGSLASRLGSRIRQKEGISYGVGSQFVARPLDRSGTWTAFAIYAPENLSRLEAAFREELERARKEGFTADELGQAKSGFLQQRLQTRANDNSLAALLANQLFVDRDMAFEQSLDEQIGRLTTAEVNAAIRKYVDPAKLVIVKAGDFEKVKATP